MLNKIYGFLKKIVTYFSYFFSCIIIFTNGRNKELLNYIVGVVNSQFYNKYIWIWAVLQGNGDLQQFYWCSWKHTCWFWLRGWDGFLEFLYEKCGKNCGYFTSLFIRFLAPCFGFLPFISVSLSFPRFSFHFLDSISDSSDQNSILKSFYIFKMHNLKHDNPH